MKGAHLKLLTILALLPFLLNAQVGVGTTSPNGKLTVDASLDTTAALELMPQATPTTNLAAGQLAVIGNELYVYDTSRSKWLSMNSIAIPFSQNGGATASLLRYGNMRSNNSGAAMPLNGTIVAISGVASGGEAGKDFDIIVRNGTTDQSTTAYTMTGYTFNETTTDIDFAAGDYLKVDVGSVGGAVDNLSITMWVKWRQ